MRRAPHSESTFEAVNSWTGEQDGLKDIVSLNKRTIGNQINANQVRELGERGESERNVLYRIPRSVGSGEGETVGTHHGVELNSQILHSWKGFDERCKGLLRQLRRPI